MKNIYINERVLKWFSSLFCVIINWSSLSSSSSLLPSSSSLSFIKQIAFLFFLSFCFLWVKQYYNAQTFILLLKLFFICLSVFLYGKHTYSMQYLKNKKILPFKEKISKRSIRLAKTRSNRFVFCDRQTKNIIK
jgi:hypothetical protein